MFGKFSHLGRVTGKLFMNDDLCVHFCKTSSAHISGRVVNGVIARATS